MDPSRAYPQRPILAVSVAVIRGETVLLARRAHAPGAGAYSLPGGVVELGETVESAALRELMEEVSVNARLVGLVSARNVIRHDADGRIQRHFVVITFAAEWLSGEGTLSDEADDIRWCRVEDMAGLTTTDGLADVVALAFEHMRRA